MQAQNFFALCIIQNGGSMKTYAEFLSSCMSLINKSIICAGCGDGPSFNSLQIISIISSNYTTARCPYCGKVIYFFITEEAKKYERTTKV